MSPLSYLVNLFSLLPYTESSFSFPSKADSTVVSAITYDGMGTGGKKKKKQTKPLESNNSEANPRALLAHAPCHS